MRFRTANAPCPTVRICSSVWVACMHRCPRWESSLCRFGVRIVDTVVALSGFLRCGRCVVCGRRVGVGAGITYGRVSVPLHRFHIEVPGILSLSFFPCSFVSLRSLFSFSFSLSSACSFPCSDSLGWCLFACRGSSPAGGREPPAARGGGREDGEI